MLHPLSTDWFLRIVELNGFELDYPARDISIPALPSYIPVVRPNAWPGNLPPLEALAIPLSEVGPLARKVDERGIPAKQLLGLAEHQPLIVLGFANDDFLERHWPQHERRRLLSAIKALKPDAAIAWGYSVWHRHARGWAYPRIEHLYGLKRSLKIYAELQALDVPAIPHVYWGKQHDLDRWAGWLAENPSVTTIAVDLQTVDQPSSWRDAVHALEYLRASLQRRVHLLISGVCRRERVIFLRSLWPESSLRNMGAAFASAFRFKQPYGLACPWATNPSAWSKYEIFRHVADQYATLGRIGDTNDLQSYPSADCDASSNPYGGVISAIGSSAHRCVPAAQHGFADIDEQWPRATARSVA